MPPTENKPIMAFKDRAQQTKNKMISRGKRTSFYEKTHEKNHKPNASRFSKVKVNQSVNNNKTTAPVTLAPTRLLFVFIYFYDLCGHVVTFPSCPAFFPPLLSRDGRASTTFI